MEPGLEWAFKAMKTNRIWSSFIAYLREGLTKLCGDEMAPGSLWRCRGLYHGVMGEVEGSGVAVAAVAAMVGVGGRCGRCRLQVRQKWVVCRRCVAT